MEAYIKSIFCCNFSCLFYSNHLQIRHLLPTLTSSCSTCTPLTQMSLCTLYTHMRTQTHTLLLLSPLRQELSLHWFCKITAILPPHTTRSHSQGIKYCCSGYSCHYTDDKGVPSCLYSNVAINPIAFSTKSCAGPSTSSVPNEMLRYLYLMAFFHYTVPARLFVWFSTV